MRPLPARILLFSVGVAGLAAGYLTGHLIFYVVALGAGVLLSTTLSTRRMPVTQALLRFVGSEVEVRVWGRSPQPDDGALVVTSVNALGAGFHVFFRDSAGTSIHLKVAQPRDVRLAPDEVVIRDARYVQWNVRKIAAVQGAAAVVVGLKSARDVTAGASDVTAGASDVMAGASDVTAGTSDVPAGASDFPAGTSDFPAGASDVTAGTSDFPAGTSDFPAGASRVEKDDGRVMIGVTDS